MCELVVGTEFEGVADGVSEVEDISDAEFVELVFRDDGSFERNAVADDGGDRFRFALEQALEVAGFEAVEECGRADEPVFDDLGAT